MKRYIYKAISPSGQVTTGVVSADSPSAARTQLSGEGMRVVALRVGQRQRRMGARKLSLLAREWSALLEAGLPLTDALRLLAAHRPPRETAAISQVLRAIESGSSLREALEESGAFPPFFRALSAVGEMSASLPAELGRLSTYYEKEADLRRRLVSAAAYPLFLCLFVLALFTAILTIILPSFAPLFDMLALPMPPITAAALALGLTLSEHGPLWLLEILTAVVLLTLYGATPHGRRQRDALCFRSAFLRRLFLIRLCHILSSFLKSGVPLSEALGDAAPLSGNQEGARRLQAVRQELLHGGRFPDALARAGLSTPMLYALTAAGMESGRLPEFLENAARLMTAETERRLDTLKSLLGPAFLCLAGAMAAAVFFAVMMPIFTAIGSGL